MITCTFCLAGDGQRLNAGCLRPQEKVRALNRWMSMENPFYDTTHLHGKLPKPGVDAVLAANFVKNKYFPSGEILENLPFG